MSFEIPIKVGNKHMYDYMYFRDILRDISKPCLFLHLNALEHNIQAIEQNAGKKKIRVATKSIRSVPVLRKILDYSEVFQGLMCFTAEEAIFLSEKGFDDLLIAYPVWDIQQLKKICQAGKKDIRITLMVDCMEHIDRLEMIAREEDGHFHVCIDLDLSMKIPGLYFGVYRSPIKTTKDVVETAKRIQASAYLHLDGVMGYEAQIAGVTDKDPNQVMKGLVVQKLKKKSLKKIKRKRKRVVKELEKTGIHLRFVNGGGTGSLKDTVKEECVTEVTVGSGFYNSHLFDKYKAFQFEAALGFAIQITRRPEQFIYTCLGGGYNASGPAHKDKAPEIYLPKGASFIPNEGAGEVQTPIMYKGKIQLEIGDPILLRHSKAGEICERFHEMVIIKDGEIIDTYATYRGEGKCFL